MGTKPVTEYLTLFFPIGIVPIYHNAFFTFINAQSVFGNYSNTTIFDCKYPKYDVDIANLRRKLHIKSNYWISSNSLFV